MTDPFNTLQRKEFRRMNWKNSTRQLLTLACLGLAALTASVAQAQPSKSMVSVTGSVLNMRSGPSTNTDVLWELKKGYPLQVIQRKGRWLKVRDFEGDTGWVAKSLTGRTPYHIVRVGVANVRSGPSTRNRIVGKVEQGELLRTREKRGGWVRVDRQGGRKGGWISRKLVWGW
jgi:SH3-like domain-containing protein